MLPMQAPELALKELERAAKLPGMRGLYLATNINSADLDEKRFWDVYAKAEELGWTIFLHPIDTIGRERTTRYYLKKPARQSLRHRRRGRAAHLRRRAGRVSEAGGQPAARGRDVPVAHRPPGTTAPRCARN